MNWRDRADYIGASDSGHVINEPKYGCQRQLCYAKTLTPPDYEPEETGPMRRGTLLEPLVVDEYRKRNPHVKVLMKGRERADGCPAWLRPHPDRFLEHPKRKGLGIMQAKTMRREIYFGALMGEGIREGYIRQLQVEMFAFGCRWALWAILQPDSWEFMAVEYEYNAKVAEDVVRRAEPLWRIIETIKANPAEAEHALPFGWRDKHADADAPCGNCAWRYTCLGGKMSAEAEELAERRKARGGLPEIDDPLLGRLLGYYDKLKPPLDKATKRMGTIKAAIEARLGHLGHPDGVCLNGRRVTAYQQARSSFDTRGMEADGLALDKYRKTGAAYRVIRPGKGDA